MTDFIKVATLSDVPVGECKTVLAEGREIALYNVDGRIYATDNACPHRDGPLGEGTLEGAVVTCPLHGWQFDVATGRNQLIPGKDVEALEVKVEGGNIYVKLRSAP